VTEIPLTHALVADDEPHIGRIIKMKLEQGPFRVTLVYDGREPQSFLATPGDGDSVAVAGEPLGDRAADAAAAAGDDGNFTCEPH